jgi:hypothetical protein
VIEDAEDDVAGWTSVAPRWSGSRRDGRNLKVSTPVEKGEFDDDGGMMETEAKCDLSELDYSNNKYAVLFGNTGDSPEEISATLELKIASQKGNSIDSGDLISTVLYS